MPKKGGIQLAKRTKKKQNLCVCGVCVSGCIKLSYINQSNERSQISYDSNYPTAEHLGGFWIQLDKYFSELESSTSPMRDSASGANEQRCFLDIFKTNIRGKNWYHCISARLWFSLTSNSLSLRLFLSLQTHPAHPLAGRLPLLTMTAAPFGSRSFLLCLMQQIYSFGIFCGNTQLSFNARFS
jgi:hypothetical protein